MYAFTYPITVMTFVCIFQYRRLIKQVVLCKLSDLCERVQLLLNNQVSKLE